MTAEEFDKKWNGVNVDDLSDNQLKKFKADCFDMYETEGFSDTFRTPYVDAKKYYGMKFEVIRRANRRESDLENMPMWVVRFENGDKDYCYPEEICKIEHECQDAEIIQRRLKHELGI